MLYFICIVVNIIAIATFLKKKWGLVAIVYSFGLLLLTTMMAFCVEVPETVLTMKKIFGTDLYNVLSSFLKEFSYDTLAPYLAIELIALLYTIIATLKVAEKIIKTISNKAAIFEKNDKSLNCVFIEESAFPIKRKNDRDLFNCVLLC